jgi:hypothetical protein
VLTQNHILHFMLWCMACFHPWHHLSRFSCVPFLLYDLHNYGANVHTKLISQTLSFVLMGYFCTSVAIGGVAKFS